MAANTTPVPANVTLVKTPIAKRSQIPPTAGCYIFFNAKYQIIYIGKAVNLRRRVNSYFTKSHNLRITRMVQEVAFFDFIAVANEKSALILEHNLIKRYAPKYNIVLKDDRRYPYIVISKEPNPHYLYLRKLPSQYLFAYGPLPDGMHAKMILNILQSLIPLQRCKKFTGKPCFYYHINQCSGACFQTVPPAFYRKQITKVKAFFSNQSQFVQTTLNKQMQKAASNLQFEKAEQIKQLLYKLTNALSPQNVAKVDLPDADVINRYYADRVLVTVILNYRGGVLVNKVSRIFYDVEQDDNAVALALQHWYSKNPPPTNIVVSASMINDLPSHLAGTAIRTSLSQTEQELLQLCYQNCLLFYDQEKGINHGFINYNVSNLLVSLQKHLQIPHELYEIHAFDISTWQNDVIVGGCVVYKKGFLHPQDNRMFRIELPKQNDALSIEKSVYLKYQNYQAQQKPLPDLIIIDGGKIQINAAKKALKSLNLQIPLLGLVKDAHHRTDYLLTNNSKPIFLAKNSPLFHWLTEVQNTVHKFVINKFKRLQSRQLQSNVLEEVVGVGPKTIHKLYAAFHDLASMQKASYEELAKVVGNKTTTANLYTFLHFDEQNPSIHKNRK